MERFSFPEFIAPNVVVIRQVRSDMDFGPVVKRLGITVKKEAGKVVETSGEISPMPQRVLKKGLIAPEPQR